MFASVLHIPPAAVSELPVGEFDMLCRWLDEYQRQMKEASKSG